MATLKRITRSGRSESLRGAFMVDTVRGVLRVRKWPRKRGTPKSALQRWWIDWFRQANKLAKYVDAATAARAIEITAGSGMYPRDVILSAMRGRLYSWYDQTGKVWHSMAGVQDVSDSLDFIAQSVGSILVRATDRWRGLADGNPGDLLTFVAAGVLPAYLAPPVSTVALSGGKATLAANQLILNGTVTVINYGVSDYDNAAVHDPVTNNSRMTVPPGWLFVDLGFATRWASSSAGVRLSWFQKNGAAFQGQAQHHRPASGTSEDATFSLGVPCVGGDYFETVVYQNGGPSLNLLKDNNTEFTMRRAG